MSSDFRALFVGSYAPSDEPGIHSFVLDESSGDLRLRGSFAGVRNPSYLAVHPDGDRLFAVGETGFGSDGIQGSVHGFRIDEEGGVISLAAVNQRSTAGDFPCHLDIDPTGRWLAVANYGTGNAALFPIESDAGLGEMATSVQHAGRGPNVDRQKGPHVHSATFAPDNRFLIVADLGIDRLVIYSFDADTGSLVRHGDAETEPGAGPRHLAFHPDGVHLFVVNELASSITLHQYDADTGRVRPLQTMSTLPSGVAGNLAADIHVSRSGSHVYVSNRGHNSMAVYEFEPATGLNRTAVRSCGGDGPRSFAPAPGGGYLVVANRHSDEIVVLPLLTGGSDMGEPVARATISQPSCIMFG